MFFIDVVIDSWFLISFSNLFDIPESYFFSVKPHHSKNSNGYVLHLSLLPVLILIMINTFLMIGTSVSFVIARNGKFFVIVSHIHFHKQIALWTKFMSNNKNNYNGSSDSCCKNVQKINQNSIIMYQTTTWYVIKARLSYCHIILRCLT